MSVNNTPHQEVAVVCIQYSKKEARGTQRAKIIKLFFYPVYYIF